MFAQVITGRAADAAGLRKEMDRWVAELRPDAVGFEGGTSGVTTDGTFVTVALFTDRQSAQANSGRPEQDAWWREFSSHLNGPADFAESEDVDTMGRGFSPAAGFVQVIHSRITDPAKMRQLMREMEERMAPHRPEILGGLTIWHDDATTTDVIYFTSEAEARAGERKELPNDARELFDEMLAATENPRYLDLTEPWHAT